MTPLEKELISEAVNTIGAIGRNTLREVNSAINVLSEFSILQSPLLRIRTRLEDISNQLRPLYKLLDEKKKNES